MKKQKTLEEKKVRKEALKMTAIFIVLIVVMEVVVCLLMSSFSRIAWDFGIPGYIGIACLDIFLAIAGYFDFKKEVSRYQKDSECNKTTK